MRALLMPVSIFRIMKLDTVEVSCLVDCRRVITKDHFHSNVVVVLFVRAGAGKALS